MRYSNQSFVWVVVKSLSFAIEVSQYGKVEREAAVRRYSLAFFFQSFYTLLAFFQQEITIMLQKVNGYLLDIPFFFTDEADEGIEASSICVFTFYGGLSYPFTTEFYEINRFFCFLFTKQTIYNFFNIGFLQINIQRRQDFSVVQNQTVSLLLDKGIFFQEQLGTQFVFCSEQIC